MNALTGYLAIGAIIYGLVHGITSEKCNNMQEIKSIDLIAMTVGWPAAFASTLFFDFPTSETTCKGA